MKRLTKYIAGAAICVLAVAGAAPFVWMQGNSAMPGLRVNGISVGGMSRDTLAALREESDNRLNTLSLTARYGDVREELAFKDIHVHYEADMEDQILAAGRSGNLVKDWLTRWEAVLTGVALHLHPAYDEQALIGRVRQMARTYGQDAEGSRPVWNADGSVTLTPGRPYLKIDKERLKEAVEAVLRTGEAGEVTIPVTEENNLNLSAEEYKSINAVLGKYTTYYGSNPNRVRNIKIAAGTISGWVVRPGEIFSFNETTGERAPEKGYMDAPVIVNGKAVPGVGGGVCQASSTLFNAAMLAGLTITERTCHFSPVSYVPIGQDATVSFGTLDFCFRNDLKHSIFIYAEADDQSITTWILGNREDGSEAASVGLVSSGMLPFNVVTVIDPSQKEEKIVEEGHPGYHAVIFQSVRWRDGRVREDTFTSWYDPVDTVVTLNKAPKQAKAEKKKSKRDTSKDVAAKKEKQERKAPVAR
ncbi:MAG: VanW family protein [Dialister sp.]|nr:VanW family protein [Dialister sp.]